jgi:hypothetical protein
MCETLGVNPDDAYPINTAVVGYSQYMNYRHTLGREIDGVIIMHNEKGKQPESYFIPASKLPHPVPEAHCVQYFIMDTPWNIVCDYNLFNSWLSIKRSKLGLAL